MRYTVTEVSSCSQSSNFRDFTLDLQRAAAKSAHTLRIASAACTLVRVRSTWNENSGYCSSVDSVSVTDIGKTCETDGFVRLEFMHNMV